MSFKIAFRFPSKNQNAWFYYSVLWILFATIDAITFVQVGTKSNIIVIVSNLLSYLFLILTVIHIVVNGIHLLKNRPTFNGKKILFICFLLFLDYVLLSFEYAFAHLDKITTQKLFLIIITKLIRFL